MRWMWAAILGLVLLAPAAVAKTTAGGAELRSDAQQEHRLAQRPKVEVRSLDDQGLGSAPFRIRGESSAPKKPAADKSAPPPAKSAPAAKTAENPPATPKDAPKAEAAKPLAADSPERVQRPTETGETSGNAVAAFWIVLPK